jgi:hypothetical protein
MKNLFLIILLAPFLSFSQNFLCNDNFCGVSSAKFIIYDQKVYKGNLLDETKVILNYNNNAYYKGRSDSSFDKILDIDTEKGLVYSGLNNIYIIKDDKIFFSEYNKNRYVYFTDDQIFIVTNHVEELIWTSFGGDYLSIKSVVALLIVIKFY